MATVTIVVTGGGASSATVQLTEALPRPISRPPQLTVSDIDSPQAFVSQRGDVAAG